MPVKATSITVDELGFVYLVNENKISKLNVNGEVIFTRSNLSSGDITSLDVSDPFKVLSFFMDFGNIEFLDNTLSLTNTISLALFGLELSTLAALSYNNGFWIYNPQNMELVRIDQFLEVSDRSGNIAKVTGKEINPNFLREKNDMIYLNDPGQGIMLFDKYGTYYKTINVKGLSYFQVYDRKLIFFENGLMTILDPATMNELSFSLPSGNHKRLSLSLSTEKKWLYSLGNGKLNIYVLNRSL
jgi:hypothetical protein